jgi:hypothetical protein
MGTTRLDTALEQLIQRANLPEDEYENHRFIANLKLSDKHEQSTDFTSLLEDLFTEASENKYIAYLTSWGAHGLSDLEDPSLVDTYLLSFGKWDANGIVSTSDNIAAVPEYNEYWYEPGYLDWTAMKHNNPDSDMLIAFGGQTYEEIWSYITTASDREVLANNLVTLLNTDFPVYKRNLSANEAIGCLSKLWDGSCNYASYQLAGYVQLDGLDFDFEKQARLTDKEKDDLFALVTRIKELASDKKLSLTTYHVGADPENCSNNQIFEKCSFVEDKRSSHHGEMTSLLEKSKNLFDFFNVMTYDAGQNFKYDVAMQNYADKIGDKSKLRLGITINSQWGPEGRFTESVSNNIERSQWQAGNGYGGFFVWDIGASTEQMSMQEQVAYINVLVAVAQVGDVVTIPGPPPVEPFVRKESIKINTDQALREINRNPEILSRYFDDYKKIKIETSVGNWVRILDLPYDIDDGSVVEVTVSSGYGVRVETYNLSTKVHKGESSKYTYLNNQWTADNIIISSNTHIRALESNPNALAEYFKISSNVVIRTKDGAWTRNLHLPSSAIEGATFKLIRLSSYHVNLHTADGVIVIPKRSNITYRYLGGKWHRDPMMMSYTDALSILRSNPNEFIHLLESNKKKNILFELK